MLVILRTDLVVPQNLNEYALIYCVITRICHASEICVSWCCDCLVPRYRSTAEISGAQGDMGKTVEPSLAALRP